MNTNQLQAISAGVVARPEGNGADSGPAEKQNEPNTGESQDGYRELIAKFPAAVYACEAASGVITFYNERAAALWGRAPAAGDTDERFCGSYRLYRPDGAPLPHEETPMAIALREGREFRNEEVVIERPDGTRITVRVNIGPIRDSGGRLIGAINVFQDTSPLKQAENALRESQRWFRSMIDALPVAIYTTDAEGRLTYFNPAAVELSGRVPEIWSDQWCVSWKLYYPDGAPMPHEACPMAMAIKEGRVIYDAEAILERPDGRRICFAPYATPLRDNDGRVAGGINMLIDITERKQAEQERARLLQLERASRSEAETLNEVARTLAAELDLQKLVQKATDAATQLIRAKFGAFFYNVVDEVGESYLLYTLSGAPREAFEKFGAPRKTPLFEQTFAGRGTIRSDDITKDPRYGNNPPHYGMPDGHLPVRSYLAVPVVSRSGEVLGGLFFGHPDPAVFCQRAERLVTGIASQAAIAIDNARLFAQAQKEITDRKEAAKIKARLAAIVESSNDAIISKDLSGVITSWNRGAGRLFGYSAAEAVGQDVSILVPADRAEEEAEISERIRRGEPIEQYETVRRSKDGALVDISLTVSPIVDEDGVIIGASKIARDITSRKKAEVKLRESEERFRTMADNSQIIIWLADNTGSLRFVNRAFLDFFGISHEQASNFDWTQVLHPQDRDSYLHAFTAALRNRESFRERARVRRFDGQWRWLESRGNPILDEAGKITGFLASSPDVTEIHESAQALKELDQRKDQFLANMSHEIRSPLTGIMGYADILLMKLKDPEHLQWVKTIKESGDYLSEIVNDILDLSKIEAGKLVLNIEPVSPHAVLGEIHSLMDVRARDKKLPLLLRYDGVLPPSIETDRIRLRQIIINLVSNAIKFTEHGQVEIVARFLRDEGLLQVEVIDTGIGIAPEHQAHLFEPFTQADTSSTRQYGGTGLGLTITKRLVEMLGGSVSFETELDKGTTFRVTIPTGPREQGFRPEGASAPADLAISGLPLKDRHILVVDDRREFCSLVSEYIQAAGGRTTALTSGQRAVEAVESDRCDAILLDIQMPGMDGFETAQRLRGKGFQTPIIALTASAMVGDREKCLKAGCDDYLTKPIDGRALLKTLKRYVDNSSDPFVSKRVKVLVVDDSHSTCKFLSRFFEKSGYEVISAHDGESTLAIVRSVVPDVVLMDIHLPDINGFQLMQRLKALEGVNKAKFVGLSGFRDRLDQRFMAFEHFLEKPLDSDQLRRLLQFIST